MNAINGHAAAFAENVPLIHIVGYPNREYMKKQPSIHNSVQCGDLYNTFKIFQNISCDAIILDDVETSPEIIDRMILKCM